MSGRTKVVITQELGTDNECYYLNIAHPTSVCPMLFVSSVILPFFLKRLVSDCNSLRDVFISVKFGGPGGQTYDEQIALIKNHYYLHYLSSSNVSSFTLVKDDSIEFT